MTEIIVTGTIDGTIVKKYTSRVKTFIHNKSCNIFLILSEICIVISLCSNYYLEQHHKTINMGGFSVVSLNEILNFISKHNLHKDFILCLHILMIIIIKGGHKPGKHENVRDQLW